jgi:hypothetical protein
LGVKGVRKRDLRQVQASMEMRENFSRPSENLVRCRA